MLWKEVKTWAKERGYKADRKKIDGETNSYHYTWFKIDDDSIKGETTSVSKLATSIFNHFTNGEFVQYQQDYKEALSQKDIIHEEPAGW